MSQKFKPLGDRVFVKRLEGQEKTAGGIFIPDSAKEKLQIGAVLAVGPGRWDTTGKQIAPQVKEGDHIYFGKYSGTEVMDANHLVIKEDEILGILEK